LLERHPPTARLVRENIERLGLADRVEVQVADAFRWSAQPEYWPSGPWIVFCCPPYGFYRDRKAEMDPLLSTIVRHGPAGSTVVVEAPADFDPQVLPDAPQWEVRTYPPALLAILYATGAAG
jgi:hypothetical protein